MSHIPQDTGARLFATPENSYKFLALNAGSYFLSPYCQGHFHLLPCKKGELPEIWVLPLEHSSHLCVEQIVEVWPLLSKWWWESQGHFLFSSWSTFLSFHDKACSLSYRNFQGLSPWNLIYNTGNHKRPTLQKGTRPWKLSRWFTTVIFLKDRKPKAPGLFLQVPFYPPLPLSSRQLPCFLTIPMLQSWTFICFRFPDVFLLPPLWKRCPKSPSIFFLFPLQYRLNRYYLMI